MVLTHFLLNYTLEVRIGFMFFHKQQARSSCIVHWPKSTSNLLDLFRMSLARTFEISQGFSYPYAVYFNFAFYNYVWVPFDWLKNLWYVTNNFYKNGDWFAFYLKKIDCLSNSKSKWWACKNSETGLRLGVRKELLLLIWMFIS